MQALFRAAIAAFAALLGFSLFALVQSSAANGEEVVATRQDGVTLLSEDDGGDDSDGDGDQTGGVTTGNTNTSTGRGVTNGDTTLTGATFASRTGVSNDATGSRMTVVSRDRDISADDLTKDRTMDGGDPTRDRTANHTNDRTKNDTR